MILPQPKDAVHKAWLYRTLTTICDEPKLASALAFKGGTCAAMLGWLDRFSIDLDFDFRGSVTDLPEIKQLLETAFASIGLTIKDQSRHGLQYFLEYPAPRGDRNTLSIDATFPPPRANTYATLHLSDIDRIAVCQTKETMFANKLVAPLDRYRLRQSVAGRDIYDIHSFFLQGFGYNAAVIEERRQTSLGQFWQDLLAFLQTQVTEKILTEDLNLLLPPEKFRQIRKYLLPETMRLVKEQGGK